MVIHKQKTMTDFDKRNIYLIIQQSLSAISDKKIEIVSCSPYYAIDGTSLAKVTLPSTAKKLKAETFHYCTRLSEIVIPDSITSLNFEYDPFMFKGTALPLKSQAKLKKLGYTGHFSN